MTVAASETMPLRVEKLYNEYNATAAFAVTSLLAVLALLTLGLKTLLEWKTARAQALAQQTAPEETHLVAGRAYRTAPAARVVSSAGSA